MIVFMYLFVQYEKLVCSTQVSLTNGWSVSVNDLYEIWNVLCLESCAGMCHDGGYRCDWDGGNVKQCAVVVAVVAAAVAAVMDFGLVVAVVD